MSEELNNRQLDETSSDLQFAASVIFPGFDYSALRVAMENLKMPMRMVMMKLLTTRNQFLPMWPISLRALNLSTRRRCNMPGW